MTVAVGNLRERAARAAPRMLTKQAPVPLRVGAVKVTTALAIRWLAVVGQTATILITAYVMELPVPVVDCLALVSASVLLNVAIWLARRRVDWLSERETALQLSFDALQLGLLLYLTGGLLNPFALLVLAPATVSATMLGRWSTLGLGGLVIAIITMLAIWHRPLPWAPGNLEVPDLYIFGVWVALALAVAFVTVYAWRVAVEARSMADALAATQMAFSREQEMASLGALAAATAHELGSPLGTIAVVARELANEVSPDDPIRDDVELLLSESDRCRRILANLAQRPETDAGAPFAAPPISALIDELVREMADARTPLLVQPLSLDGSSEPEVARRVEMMRGLASYLRNAVQFARGRVVVGVEWTLGHITVTVDDDGPGFASTIVSRLGEPWLSTRRGVDGHMGLGVFIAETLLARIGATVTYGRAPIGGARVVIRWPRTDVGSETTPS